MSGWDSKEPFATFYKSGAERWGRPNTRPRMYLGYHYANILAPQMGVSFNGLISPNFPQLIIDALGLVSGDSIALIGAGFNATGFGLKALGIDVIATDTSAWIDAVKGETEEADIRDMVIGVGLDPDVDTFKGPRGPGYHACDLWLHGGRANPQPRGKGLILPEDLSSRKSRNTVVKKLKSKPKWVATEQVLNSIPEAEGLQLCEDVARFASENGGTVVHMLSPLKSYKQGQSEALTWRRYAEWREWLDTNGFEAQLILPQTSAWDQGVTPLSVDWPGKPAHVKAYSGVF